MAAERLTGTEIEDLKGMAAAHFWPHARQAGDLSDDTGVRIVTSAEGVWVEDAAGKRWFDTISGMWLKNIGHGRKEIADAVYEQMLDISYTPGGTVAPATVNLAAKVAGLAPDKESRVYFVSGGSEAVETAVKMAKNYQKNIGEPTRWKVISRTGSYHGATLACMSMGGGSPSVPQNFGPLMPGNIHVAQPDEYRCVYCRDRGGCNLECARDVDRAIEHEGAATVAAFIGEPVSVASGIHIPHPEYWPTIREICDKHGVVMICDEVITGFGRTGKLFALDHWGIEPDIVQFAKAITSGYFPFGGIGVSDVIARTLHDDGRPWMHAYTYSAHPVGCAVAQRMLQIVRDEGFSEQAATKGQYLIDSLQAALGDHLNVGDIRGKGLMCAVELVEDLATKRPFPAIDQVGLRVHRAAIERGLFSRIKGDSYLLAPPIVTTNQQIDRIVESVTGAVREVLS